MPRDKLNPLPPQFASLMSVIIALHDLALTREALAIHRCDENITRYTTALKNKLQAVKHHEEMIRNNRGRYV